MLKDIAKQLFTSESRSESKSESNPANLDSEGVNQASSQPVRLNEDSVQDNARTFIERELRNGPRFINDIINGYIDARKGDRQKAQPLIEELMVARRELGVQAITNDNGFWWVLAKKR